MGDLDEEMDLNIDNYTIDELLLVYNLDTTATKNEIYAKSLLFLNRFEGGEDKKEFYDFFVKARDKLVSFVESTYDFDEEYSLLITQEDDTNIDPAHINANKKILEDRYVFDDRDSNIVVNKVMKTIVINTENLTTDDNVSDFTFHFSDTLYDVLSLSLYSYTIPYTWYNIDETYGNDRFIIDDSGAGSTIIIIKSGNYTPVQLIQEIQTQINDGDTGIGLQGAVEKITLSYDEINGKINVIFNKSYYNKVIFYDGTFGTPTNNLGYILGFRNDQLSEISKPSGSTNIVTSKSICSIITTKYLQIYLDDFQRNRLPSNLLNTYDDKLQKIDNNHKFDYLERNANTDSKTFGYVVPSEPRNLTQNQIYAINAIERANTGLDACGLPNTSVSNNDPPSDSDLFAIIHPFSNQTQKPTTGDILTSSDISLPYNKRIYFGPTNLDAFRIKLLDDKGNTVNMNQFHYTISLICECLYKKPK